MTPLAGTRRAARMALTRVVNPVCVRLMRSPLHGLLSPRLVTLSFSGRRTGHRYELPIGYAVVDPASAGHLGGLGSATPTTGAVGGSGQPTTGERLLVATDARWRWNFQTAYPATVWLRGRRRTGIGAVVEDARRLSSSWATLLTRRPVIGRLSGVTVGADGVVDPLSLGRAKAAGWNILEIRLSGADGDRTVVAAPAEPDDASPDPATADLVGRVAVVTGGTSGIGRAAALALAARGADVTVVGRDDRRGQETERAAAGLHGRIAFLRADLSRPAAVRTAAAELLARHRRIHIIVHSAGAHVLTRTRTPEGIEANFAINFLSKFHLTQLLVPALSRGGHEVGRTSDTRDGYEHPGSESGARTARVVVIGSPVVAPRRTLLLDVAAGDKSVAPMRAMLSSGIATAVWTVELARRVADRGITVTNVTPGLVRTAISRTWPRPARWLDRALMAVAGLPPEEGAEPALYLATANEVEGVTGRFYRRFHEARVSAGLHDPALAQRLWRLSEQLTSVPPPSAQPPAAPSGPSARGARL